MRILVCITVYIVLCGLFIPTVQAQFDFKGNTTVPLAPEVAALNRFIENPIDLHSGLQNISIPVYDIKLKGITIPIALKYYSGGVKVDEIATEEGLGWSLHAGGAVSSSVRGRPDEEGRWPGSMYANFDPMSFRTHYPGGQVPGSHNGGDFLDLLNLYNAGSQLGEYEKMEYLKTVVNGTGDSEPDMYFYSMPGHEGGRFFYDNSQTARLVPARRIKIEKLTDPLGWVSGYRITDEQGTIFEFNRRTTSSTVSQEMCGITAEQRGFTNATFHITRIVTVAGDIATFYYTPYTYTFKNQSTFWRKLKNAGDAYQCNEFITSTTGSCYNEKQSETIMTTVTLDSIVTNRGHRVNFTYQADRMDEGVKRLADVTVLVKLGTAYSLIHRTDLHHSYFTRPYAGTDKMQFRLKLDSVTQSGMPPYRFEYHAGHLPRRLSFDQDHWGFYNAANNEIFLPKDLQYGFADGANREPSLEPTKIGVLQKIIYPTGGFTEFMYEQNTFFKPSEEYVYYTNETYNIVSEPNMTKTVTFTLGLHDLPLTLSWSNTYIGQNTHNNFNNIYLHRGSNPSINNTMIRGFQGSEFQTSGNEPAYNVYSDATYTFIATNYTDPYSNEPEYTGWASLTYSKRNVGITPSENPIGGLRIQRIKHCSELAGDCLEKRYEYKTPDGKSSGEAMRKPTYSHATPQQFWASNNLCTTPMQITCTPYFQSSTPTNSLVNSQSRHIVYSWVSVYTADTQDTTRTSHKFIAFMDDLDPGRSEDILNGLPLEITYYRHKGNGFLPLKKTEHFYTFHSELEGNENDSQVFSVRGLEISLANAPQLIQLPCTNDPFVYQSSLDFVIEPYELTSFWHYKNKTTETSYDLLGNEILINTTEYFYDNSTHMQLSRTETTNSRNGKSGVKMSYPADVNATLPVNTLIANNQISTILESTQYEITGSNTVITSGDLYTYKLHNNRVVIDTLFKFFTQMPIVNHQVTAYNGTFYDPHYAPAIAIDSLDNNQNITQYTDLTTGLTHTLLWDTDYNHMIASVQNASLNKVYYTSFEKYDGVESNHAKTGSYVHQGSYTFTAPSAGTYVLSYWSKASPEAPWILNRSEVTISSPLTHTIQVGGTAILDEVKLYPKGALMTTYNFFPGIGVSEITDVNDIVMHYEYDAFNRLKFVRDDHGSIVKAMSYQYKQY